MWKDWWDTYGGRSVGIAAGFLLGIIYLISGFWDMLFFALLLGVGYAIGKNKDLKRGPLVRWERLTEWMNDRWPWTR